VIFHVVLTELEIVNFLLSHLVKACGSFSAQWAEQKRQLGEGWAQTTTL
jgi:hypothetical protein